MNNITLLQINSFLKILKKVAKGKKNLKVRVFKIDSS